ncbi:hypothetical protein PENSPDRAFT_679424 [Peniophora sp. CONT]|nr:hypothetical protein PENSPDRAFT_679424 [Peniophora sp. CONT]
MSILIPLTPVIPRTPRTAHSGGNTPSRGPSRRASNSRCPTPTFRRQGPFSAAALASALTPIYVLRNSSPIGALPVELLQQIFLLLSPSSSAEYRVPIALTHVCRRWRDIAFCLPELWIHIPLCSLSWAAAFVSRSRSMSIRLSHSYASGASAYNFAIALYLATVSRIEHATFTARPGEQAMFTRTTTALAKAPLERTKTIRLALESWGAGGAPMLSVPSIRAPKLEVLDLSGVGIAHDNALFDAPLRELVLSSCELEASPLNLLNIIARCSDTLERLIIDDSLSRAFVGALSHLNEASIHPIALPHLRVLTLAGPSPILASILSNILIPTSTERTLRAYPTREGPAELLNALAPSGIGAAVDIWAERFVLDFVSGPSAGEIPSFHSFEWDESFASRARETALKSCSGRTTLDIYSPPSDDSDVEVLAPLGPAYAPSVLMPLLPAMTGASLRAAHPDFSRVATWSGMRSTRFVKAVERVYVRPEAAAALALALSADEGLMANLKEVYVASGASRVIGEVLVREEGDEELDVRVGGMSVRQALSVRKGVRVVEA